MIVTGKPGKPPMELKKLIESLIELQAQRGPDIDVKTMPVFMFDPQRGKRPGICSFYVGEQSQLKDHRRVKTIRTVILEIT
jgi:hypothetical protein